METEEWRKVTHRLSTTSIVLPKAEMSMACIGADGATVWDEAQQRIYPKPAYGGKKQLLPVIPKQPKVSKNSNH